MKAHILNKLETEGLITHEQSGKIISGELMAPFSLHWELKTILYLGVLLLNVGLGWLIYLNLDEIGHGVIIAGIALVCAGSFAFAWRHRVPFSPEKTESPSPFYDYALLLGCFTFLILEGYLQYQYQFFGEKYGLATFLPAVLFFAVAYRFDHKAVLSLGITALAAWVGISITPLTLLRDNDFSNDRLIYMGLLLGAVLTGAAFFLGDRNIKKHFSFTYLNFGSHVLFVACLAGMMVLEKYWLFVPLLAAVTAAFIGYARREQSFYFLIVAMVYAYVGLTYLVFLMDALESGLAFFYFVFSCAGVIWFLLRYKKILSPPQR
jgi:hypothetical protein